MVDNYHYIIIGAGPSGLTLATILSSYKKKILVIDRESGIGGCHRVKRVNGYMTEHGPRIYSGAYKNTMMIMKKMELNFNDFFTKYDFNIGNIGGKTLFDFQYWELFALVKQFIKLVFGSNSSKNISCYQFMISNKFTRRTMDYIDRLCRLTDGAGSKRYSLFELLQLFNQNFFYNLYLPKNPTDTHLFKEIKKRMNNVDFLLGSQVKDIITKNNKIESINFDNKKIRINKEKVIIATPLFNLFKMLNWNTNLVKELEYNTYIPIIFHWKKKIKLPKVWGFPKSDWGVAFIVLSDYMKFKKSKIVISTCITITGKKSNYLGKTPDQCDKNELIKEVFRQLRESFPNLPIPQESIISPNIYKKNAKWQGLDKAFLEVPNVKKKIDKLKIFQKNNFSVKNIKNLYSLGTHNLKSTYHFTSMESATINAINLAHILVPRSKVDYVLQKSFNFSDLIYLVFMIIIIAVIIKKLKR